MTPPADRRVEYGSGSVYKRKSDGLWIAVIEAADKYGYTEGGGRKRLTVSGKTEGQAKRRRRDRILELEKGRANIGRTTVKSWADEYLPMRVRNMSPKGYNALANPIKNWVVPTIGGKRLDQLTRRDVRAVHDACRRAERSAGDVHRALMTMLNAAVEEGHHVPPGVLVVKAPTADKSDRTSMTIPEGLRLLRAAAEHPRGARWLFTILYGARMGECLGLTRDAIDLDAGRWGEAVIEWQLQPLPYNVPRDRTSGFRTPDGYEVRHLVDAYHLVRPKSRQGYRVAPFLPFVQTAIQRAIDTAPDNPWGLLWPDVNGRPMNDKHDRAEWWALQEAAGIHHPTRTREVDGKTVAAYYHVHECRSFAATMLLEAGVDEHIITTLLGHSSITTSRKYMTVRREPLLEAMERVGERLQLG